MNYSASNEEKKENSAGGPVSCHCEEVCNSQFLQSRIGIESLARDLNPDLLENERELPEIEERFEQSPSDTSHISSSDTPTEQQQHQQQSQAEESVLLHRRSRITPEDVFNRNNLQYLTQNVENLREILQVVSTNAEFAQNLSYEMQRRSTFHFGTARALNNVQSSILNSQNQIYEQLHQIRSIIDENRINEQQMGLLGLISSLFSAHRDSQTSPPTSPRIFSNKVQRLLEKNYQKIFLLTFIISFFLALWATLQGLNSNEFTLTNFMALLESPHQSRFFTIASTCCYFLALIQFHQKLHKLFFADEEYHFWKNLKTIMPEYSPFYDSGFYILANPEIIQNKISFCLMLWLLLWKILITKTSFLIYQKLNNVVMSAGGGLTSNFLALRRVKLLSLIYLLLNLTVSFGVIWKVWDSSFQTVLIFLTLTLLSQLEPLKIFLSSYILTKNYSLITNNNTKELKDPRFQIELYLDLACQAITLILISFLAFFYTSFLIGFAILCWMSFNNVIQKLNQCFTKYSSWKKLNKKLNELFPLVEQTATDEICSICHDNLLIYRKIPCGHKFHLKCLFYWIETQRTCPNCRGGVPNVSEILNNY